MFQRIDDTNPAICCYPWGSNITNGKSSLELLRTTIEAYFKSEQSFKCPCPQPCREKKTVLLSRQLSPSTMDLRSQTLENHKGRAKNKWVCRDAEWQSRKMFDGLRVQIMILRKERTRTESLSYTQIMATADAFNAVGLFFGLSVLSLYDSIEGLLILLTSRSGKGLCCC
jgi:hypothetical protein